MPCTHGKGNSVRSVRSTPMTSLAERLRTTRARVRSAALAAGRDPADVRLLLAVKTQPAERILEALEAEGEHGALSGAMLLGHNKVQEMVATGPPLSEASQHTGRAHEMHLIGHLQSNKINAALPWASCVQTVDTARLAGKLDAAVARQIERGEREFRDGHPVPLEIMVQVNTSGEESKAGVAPGQARELALAAAALPHLRLTGFMTIGAHTDDAAAVRASFDRLAEIRDDVAGSGEPDAAGAVELSMGMSGDLEIAVAAGATIVRLGTAVFGAREVV